jgi:hypothetical protein
MLQLYFAVLLTVRHSETNVSCVGHSTAAAQCENARRHREPHNDASVALVLQESCVYCNCAASLVMCDLKKRQTSNLCCLRNSTAAAAAVVVVDAWLLDQKVVHATACTAVCRGFVVALRI